MKEEFSKKKKRTPRLLTYLRLSFKNESTIRQGGFVGVTQDSDPDGSNFVVSDDEIHALAAIDQPGQ